MKNESGCLFYYLVLYNMHRFHSLIMLHNALYNRCCSTIILRQMVTVLYKHHLMISILVS
jgi:hypothetical protein